MQVSKDNGNMLLHPIILEGILSKHKASLAKISYCLFLPKQIKFCSRESVYRGERNIDYQKAQYCCYN